MRLRACENVLDYELLDVVEPFGSQALRKGQHTRFDRLELLRVLPRIPDRHIDQRVLCIHDAQILCRLADPETASFCDVFIADEYLLMTLEYVGGSTLGQARQAGCFGAADALHYACHILSAVDYTHRYSMVQRGKSPESILVASRGLAQLSGAAFAKMPSFLEVTHRRKQDGRATSAAPEQIQNPSVAVRRAELYSVGATLYKFLTGHPPFGGLEPLAVEERQPNDQPLSGAAPENRLRERVSNAVLGHLAVPPTERRQSAKEFHRELQQLYAAELSDRCQNAVAVLGSD